MGWGMPKSPWTALPLLAVIALAGCATPPSPPPAAPPPAPPPAEAAPPAPPGPPAASSDQDFINQAMGMGAAEMGMGRLAEGKAASKPIRALAARMIADHTRENGRLAALARHLNIDVKPTPDQPPPELLTSSGPEFDKAYIGLVIATHRNLIGLFESEANNGQDPRIKHYARGVLAILHHHLHDAEAIGHTIGL
jgi:putative membrane protein